MIRGNLDVLRAARDMDLIYIPSVSYFYFALIAALFHRLRGRRIVYQFHDLITTRSARLRFTSLFISDFVHNTRLGYDEVSRANPFIAKVRNLIIPLTVHFPPDGHSSNGQEGFDGKHNVVFVGQIAEHKGIDILLSAFKLLNRNNGNEVRLHLIGGCADERLKKTLDELTLNSGRSVKYWGYRDDISGFLKKADVLVQTSPAATNESFGRAVVEGMSFGVPAVCFRSGALQEIVIPGHTGLVCEEETAECLAKNIERMLADNDLRKRCGQNAREIYQERYEQSRVKRLWLEAFAAQPSAE